VTQVHFEQRLLNIQEAVSALVQNHGSLKRGFSSLSQQANRIIEEIDFYQNNKNIQQFEDLNKYFITDKNKIQNLDDTEKACIFITARYRTGSSYLYSLFSSLKNTVAFLEPLHPNLLDIIDKDKNWHETHKLIASHTFKSKYFNEYKSLDVSCLSSLYKDYFSYRKILASASDGYDELKDYLGFILASVPEKLKVLQFNRVDYRLGWLKFNFPQALIVNLRRNPRDIYASYVNSHLKRKGIGVQQKKIEFNPDDNIGYLYHLDEYINVLDRYSIIPINSIEKLNDYEKVYLLNKLSNLWADNFADLVIEYENLIDNPVSILRMIVSQIKGFKLNFATEIIEARKDRVNVWQNYHAEAWFQACESKCDRILEQRLSSPLSQKFTLMTPAELEQTQVLLHQSRKELEQFKSQMRHTETLLTQSPVQVQQIPEKVKQKISTDTPSPLIVIDGIFFQLYKTGIARVWRSLLEEWSKKAFSQHILLLDRAGTAPKIPGIQYRTVPPYDYGSTDADREMLQQVCDQEGADLFISTYYTTPLSTPSVFMAYDMIPEVLEWDMNNPMWQEKHRAIQQASAYLAISENTARDLVRFFPEISSELVRVAACGVKSSFYPANLEEVNSFRTKYGISKPYFMLVVTGGGHKNTNLFFQAFTQLYSKQGFDIVCTGNRPLLAPELRAYSSGSVVHMLQLSDEELRLAYSGAVSLVYPSKHEGFGLPVLEAMACGCPVITCPNASIPEVAGKAALYVNDTDINGLANALCEVQKPDVRNSLIAAGLEQAKKFSWVKMAEIVSSVLIEATLLPLNLNDINLIIFPNWSQPEESLGIELGRVIKMIGTHPDKNHITLLIDTSNTSEEDANLFLSGVAMNLLMQEDLDVTEGAKISLVGHLAEVQRKSLLHRLHARIILENENREVIAQTIALVGAERIPSYSIESIRDIRVIDSNPIVKPAKGWSKVKSVQGKPRIDVVLQAYGLHGWSLWRGWTNVLQQQGLLNRVFAPIADWGSQEPKQDDGLFEYLKHPEADIMLLLGFDWHSQSLHNTQKWQERFHQAPIQKIAIFQESYSAKVVQNSRTWQQQLSQVLATTISCIDAIVCNHEPDVRFLQEQENISLPIIFLPFAIDPNIFKVNVPFEERLNRAAFRGNISPYFSEETYSLRRQFLEVLVKHDYVDLFPFQYGSSDPSDFLTLDGVYRYVTQLNAYRLHLNLPSISTTITARPFEIMACGGVLLQNKVIGEQSNQLFQDGKHLVYYDSENPEDLIGKINYLIDNPEVAKGIAVEGHKLCYEQHTLLNRIQAILEWLGINYDVHNRSQAVASHEE